MTLAATGPTALWYLTRATGAVTLLLLTASVVLGIVSVGRMQRRGWPRFVIEGIHRNVSLLSIVVLAVHIATSVLDPFAGIHLLDAFIPFTGSYRPIWLGLGALASDLLIAIAVTSVLRRHLGLGAWRAVHWLSYLCWPIAVVHTFGTGSDVRQLWLQALCAVCIVAVVLAVWLRIGFGWPSHRRLRGTAVAASIALPAALLVWLPSGPLGSDWARRAGTPAKLLPPLASTAPRVSAFSAAVSGTVSQTTNSGGQAVVDIQLTVAASQLTRLHVQIVGNAQSGGVQMSTSSVSIGTASAPRSFSGQITSLEGTDIHAQVASAAQTLELALSLRLSGADHLASGTLEVTVGQ